ncbi:MAG: CapA family protein [Clostridia bacterium]|nr:CapA family protein [Clostridia bacterium]
MKRFAVIIAMLLLLSSCRKLEEAPPETTAPDQTSSEIVTTELTETEFETETEIETDSETESPVNASNDGIVSIIMAGDVLLHDKVAASGKMNDGSYNYDHMFSNVKEDIENADLAIINQEVILGGKDLGLSGYPNFNGAFEVGDSLVKSGFDVVLHATNHALDKGKKGLLSCIDFWEENYPHIAYLGISDTKEKSDNIYTTEIEGIKFAILNYTYGTNGIPLPSDMPYCVNLLNKDRIMNDVSRAKEISDFVIVCPHWGTEYKLTADNNQKYWTNVFFEAGVDLVIGTHPHVVEPVELIEKNGHSMLVYYSIGNYINSTAQTGTGIANRMLGALADISVSKTENDVAITDYGIIPIVSHVKSGEGQCTVYKLDDYTEELASQNEIIYSDSSFSLSYLQNLCESVFGDLYN